MGCSASLPPAYGDVHYINKKHLAACLQIVARTTDPQRWKLAYAHASSRIAMAHGLSPVSPEMAWRRSDVIIQYAIAAGVELRQGQIRSLRGFCSSLARADL